ncbi:MAG: DUF1329 domain-containing protein [Deltaproteobacteria bacterium]|nr:DUF1329 domain-containing protein [Deltaproteobacteria bacterium]
MVRIEGFLCRFVLFCCAAVLGLVTVSSAQVAKYPIASYEGAELAKVREWEKTWVGKKIDDTNLDQVKEFLPETLVALMKDKATWGDGWFTIVPYQTYPFTPGRLKYTKEGKAKLDEKGLLVDWIAGVPFPEPKDGAEVAWNFDTWNRFDQSYRYPKGYLTDGRLKYDRVVAQRTTIQQFYGRLDTEPVPAFPDNPKGILRGEFVEFTDPPEVKGQISLSIRYTEWDRPYDTWAWIPSLRRVRRLSAAQRMDTQDGTDFCNDDNGIWNGLLTRNKYKLMGRKEYLLSRHQDMSKIVHKEGECVFGGFERERVNAWVVDVEHTEPGYIYSHQVWIVDPELWKIIYADKYDKYGKLWKVQEHAHVVVKGENGVEDVDYFGSQGIDIQRRHSTNVLIPSGNSRMGYPGTTDYYTVNNLTKLGR